jgi:tRNA threonylcarbamoyladenosine modification (KEOPS) complex  Pcc1 subunit
VRARAKLKFDFGDIRRAECVFRAVLPERDLEGSKSDVRMFLKGSSLYVEVDAPTTAALRAAINSMGRWIALADEMVGRCEKWKNYRRRSGTSLPSSSRRSSRRRL